MKKIFLIIFLLFCSSSLFSQITFNKNFRDTLKVATPSYTLIFNGQRSQYHFAWKSDTTALWDSTAIYGLGYYGDTVLLGVFNNLGVKSLTMTAPVTQTWYEFSVDRPRLYGIMIKWMNTIKGVRKIPWVLDVY